MSNNELQAQRAVRVQQGGRDRVDLGGKDGPRLPESSEVSLALGHPGEVPRRRSI